MRKPVQVLMVDDDMDDQLLFQRALKKIDLSLICETAEDGAEALIKLEIPPPPDVIFLDLNMPVMNGFECLSVLKKEEKYKNIPIIIYSTANDAGTIEKAREMGANAFFSKPADFSLLSAKLKNLLYSISDPNTQFPSTFDFVV